MKLALSLLALALPTSAQSVRTVLEAGDSVDGSQAAQVLSVAVEDSGRWSAIVRTRSRNVLLQDGVVVARDGDRIDSPSAALRTLISLFGVGDNLSLLVRLEDFDPPRPDRPRAMLRAGRAFLIEGEAADLPGFPVGTTVSAIHDSAGNAEHTVLSIVSLKPPVGSVTHGLLRFDFAPDGSVASRTLLLRDGQTLDDGSILGTLPAGQEPPIKVNAGGEWVIAASTFPSPGSFEHTSALISESGVLRRSGDPSGVQGLTARQWHGGMLNDLGAFAALDTHELNGSVLTKNGARFVQSGDVLAAGTVKSILEFSLGNSGDLYWAGLFETPSGTLARVHMRNREAIPGVPMDWTPPPVISTSGRFWVANVNGSVVLADFGASIPVPGCTPNLGTLRHTQGLILSGATPRLELDGPAPLGAVARLHLATGPAHAGDPCGIPTPYGELLFAPAQRVGTIVAGVFANESVPVDLAIPASPGLVGRVFHTQGSFRSASGTFLTNGLRLEIGADD